MSSLLIDFKNIQPGTPVAAPTAPDVPTGRGTGPIGSVSYSRDPFVYSTAVILVLAITGIGGLQYTTRSIRERQAAAMQSEMKAKAELADNVRAAKTLQKQDSLYTARTVAIHALDTDRFMWAHVMDEVNQSVPPGIWLSEIAESRITKGTPVVLLRGVAMEPERITAFITQLQQSPFFMPPRFLGADQEQSGAGGDRAIDFTLEVQYREPTDSTLLRFVELQPANRANEKVAGGALGTSNEVPGGTSVRPGDLSAQAPTVAPTVPAIKSTGAVHRQRGRL